MKFSLLPFPNARRIVTLSMALLLTWSAVGCSGASVDDRALSPSPSGQPTQVAPASLPDGQYPVQQANYDDIDGTYTLMLLNAPSSLFQTAELPMARLTPEEVTAGQGNYLKVEQGKPSLHISEDFRIEYVHNVTENQVNPQTGQQEVVVVRQEPSFWTPFAGALAGQAIANILFTPHYYFPPAYVPGRGLSGYGSYGPSYRQAVEQYQVRNNTVPTAVRNQQLRTSGRLRAPNRSIGNRPQINRPSGSGFGGTDLRRSTTPRPRTTRPRSSFGTNRPRVRMRR